MNDLDIIHNGEIFQILNTDEKSILNTQKSAPIANYSYDSCKLLVNKIHLNNDNYIMAVDETATSLINCVFDNNVDDETLVVISEMEHPSVEMNAFCAKHLLIMSKEDIHQLNISKIIEEYNKLKLSKIFFSFIGTNFITGEWIPDSFFMELKSKLKDIPHKIMIDEAQSLFVISRDYNLFDYIISTAHAVIKMFDMGVLIYKDKNESYGKDAYNWSEEYIKRLDIFLPKLKYYNFEFNTKMKDIFAALLASGKVELYNSVPHIFTLSIKDSLKLSDDEIYKLQEDYYINVFHSKDHFEVRFRFAEILIDPTRFYDGLKYLYSILTKEYPSICYSNQERIEDARSTNSKDN